MRAMVCALGLMVLAGLACESRVPFDPKAHHAELKKAGVSLEGLSDPLDVGDGRLFEAIHVPKEGAFQARARAIGAVLVSRAEARGLPRDPGTWRRSAEPHTAGELGKLLSYKSRALPADGGVDPFELSVAAVVLARYHGMKAEVARAPAAPDAFDAFPPIVAKIHGPEGASHIETWGQKVSKDTLVTLTPVELVGLHAVRKGRAALLRKDLVLAREHVVRALKFAPNVAVTHLWSSEVLELSERIDEALLAAREALKTRDTPFVRFMLARLLRRTGKLDEAGDQIKHVLAAKPDWDEAIRERAMWMCASGRGEEAMRVLSELSETYPKMWRAHRDAAYIALAMQKEEPLRVFLKRGRRAFPAEESWDVLSQGARNIGDPDAWPRTLGFRMEPYAACAVSSNGTPPPESH